jgi:hypothetical protein
VTGARRTLGNVAQRLTHQAGPTPDARGARRSGDHEDPGLGKALLAELRAALAEHCITAELRPDVAALAVRNQPEGQSIWVFVSFGGRYFSWNNAENQHPVFDVKGAARRIATHIHTAVARESGS